LAEHKLEDSQTDLKLDPLLIKPIIIDENSPKHLNKINSRISTEFISHGIYDIS